MTKKVALINDLSGFGRCSLTAAIPVLAVMGHQPCPLPTAILTAQTGYPSYVCEDYTERMPDFTREWGKAGKNFDGIYTGFMTGIRQIEVVSEFLDVFYKEDTLLLVDPVLGDNGSSYGFYTSRMGEAMKALAERADIVTPNLTELCFLTGSCYEEIMELEDAALLDATRRLGKNLLNKSGKIVVVTGIPYHDGETGEGCIGNYHISESGAELIAFSRQPGSFSGTGDLFASALIGGVLRGDTSEMAVRTAGKFLERAIAESNRNGTPCQEGVDFEKYLGMLINS